jgi:hypothetical protein
MKTHHAFFALLLMACGCSSPQDPLTISVRKVNQHPFLSDHDRVLVASVGGQEVDSQPIYPDPGGGVHLHYVRTGDAITVVDANGTWYEVARTGIRKLKWHYLRPLPQGQLRRIALDGNKEYTDAQVDNIDLGDVYQFKDPYD